MIARLKPGAISEQARNAVVLLGKEVDRAHPVPFGNEQWGAKARMLDETRIDASLRKSVLVVFAAVGFVLLIACVNMANLLLARGGPRAREMAIRQAVGAGRWRLFRQLLTESVLLASLGGAAGVAIAWAGVKLLSSVNPATAGLLGRRVAGLTLIGLTSIGIDARALAFTFGLALITGVLFGLAPAISGSRRQVSEALKGGAADRGSTTHLAAGRSVLVVTEIALAIVLLAGAGLMIRSFGRLLATRTGVDSENILTARITPPFNPQGSPALFPEVERRLAALPGVVSAGLNDCHALAGGCNGTIIWFRDREPVPKGTEPLVGIHFASPDYFRTMRIPLVAGRLFTSADRTGAPKVVLVNETAARKFWPGESPLGKPVGVGQGGFGDRAEVVGVVGDVRYGQMDEPPMPDVYVSILQSPRWSTMLFARVTGSPAAYIPALRRELAAIDTKPPRRHATAPCCWERLRPLRSSSRLWGYTA
jgi:putative ABC transport system permease protein